MKNQKLYRIISKLKKKREKGNAIDLMAGVFVMIMLFAMILGMIAHGSLVGKRLKIDNVVKEYLYIAEQYGHLCNGSDGYKSSSCQNYCAQLEQLLKDEYDCITAKVNPITTTSQVSYGNQVIVDVTVEFYNPLYEKLSAEEHGDSWFTIAGFDKIIEYTISYKATSRW